MVDPRTGRSALYPTGRRRNDDHEVTAMTLMKREPKTIDVFDRFDRMFDEWAKTFPLRRSFFGRDEDLPEVIRVDEFQDKDALVIRAELPGIDPEKDVEVTVSAHVLHIEAQRREEESTEEKGYVRRELRTGSFMRNLPLPEGVTEEDVAASYKDGILEIRIPTPAEAEPAPAKKIAISKA
jgi:HSP20 family protein